MVARCRAGLRRVAGRSSNSEPGSDRPVRCAHWLLLALSVLVGVSACGSGVHLVRLHSARLVRAGAAGVPAACAMQIPISGVPVGVLVLREGRRLSATLPIGVGPTPFGAVTTSATRTSAPATARSSITATAPTTTASTFYLQAGDEVRVTPPALFTFSYSGNRYRIMRGSVRLECGSVLLSAKRRGHRTTSLVVVLQSGQVNVRSGSDPTHAAVLTSEMLAYPAVPGTRFVVSRDAAARSTVARTLNFPIVAAEASDQALRINARVTYTAISDAKGLHLDIWPFSISPLQRATTAADDLPPYWADGLACSVGCTEPGAIPGWPLKPFHRQHAIRAAINELRPANFHVAVDIEAHNDEPVYSTVSGYASIRYEGTPEVNVAIGDHYYWHIRPAVYPGQYVVAYKTVIGYVLSGFYHVAFSEGSPGDYLNPLRPGSSLQPYTNTEPPIIGIPRIYSHGQVIVGAFAPQSFVEPGFPYETPVLAPSSLAWRLYDAHNHPLTGLEWAMRGSQNYPPGLKTVIFAPGARNPGFECFQTKRRCIPNWVYWLAGGLTQPLPLSSLPPGRYRLTVYAWDWADNTAALDYWFKVPLAHAPTAPSAASDP